MNYYTTHQTERLLIRPLRESDAESWQEYFTNNPNLRFFNLDLSKEISALSTYWIRRQLDRYSNNQYGLLALTLKDTGKLIGQCGLLLQNIEDKNQVEIGYHILPSFWHMGYATEAARYFRAFAFENKLVDEVISIIHRENIGSQKVATYNQMHRSSELVWKDMPVFIYRTFD